MDSEKIIKLRDNVSVSFKGIESGISETVERISSFVQRINPYIEYFFSDKNSESGFFNKIVLPSEQHLKGAIHNAVEIMHGDAITHNKVLEAVNKVAGLQDNVDSIVSMLEIIEIYSVNMMIMSARAGVNGQALAVVSEKMAHLSKQGSNISEAVKDKMNSLLESLEFFGKIRDQIEVLHENNLTLFEMSSNTLFGGLIKELKCMSGEVLGELAMMESVSETIKDVTTKFQHEDLVRQGFEKLIYMNELYETTDGIAFANDSGIGADRVKELSEMLSSIRGHSIAADITTLASELESALNEVSSVITFFLQMSVSTKSSRTSGAILSDLRTKLSEMITHFGDYADKVIKRKTEMDRFLTELVSSLEDFSVFFKDISTISAVFKTIILMTRIELSRSNALRSLLSGTLADVEKIPDQINKVIEEGIREHAMITESVLDSIKSYREKFVEQSKILNESVIIIKDVLVHVEESAKYHDEFMGETKTKIDDVQSFISNSLRMLHEFSSFAEAVQLEVPEGKTLSRDLIVERYGSDLERLRIFFTSPEKSGDYRSMMIASLSSEYLNSNPKTGVVDFF